MLWFVNTLTITSGTIFSAVTCFYNNCENTDYTTLKELEYLWGTKGIRALNSCNLIALAVNGDILKITQN